MTLEEIYQLLAKNNLRISTDTRTLLPGDFFVAIRGEHFDGNQYAKAALDTGASFALVDNPSLSENPQCILVENTKETLEALATLHRNTFSIPIVVIGGSNGKTTTKELIAAVLETSFVTHSTKGNLNNDIGVPLTLLAMKKETEIAVIEIGANHPLEHTKLMHIIQPTHVLVTNNGADHLEGFGSREGVRNANKEIFDEAKKRKAHAFVPTDLKDLVADSERLTRTLYPEETVTSTSDSYASVMYKKRVFSSHLFGSFNEPNILSAIAVGEHFKVPLETIKDAIARYEPTLKRSQIIKKDDYTIVLDCYNANPSSMQLSLSDFLKYSSAGERIIIVGDMLELGEEEEASHRTLLAFLSRSTETNDTVFCVGPRLLKQKKEEPFHFFLESARARSFFNTLPLSGKKIFLKASRGIQLEEVIKEKVSL